MKSTTLTAITKSKQAAQSATALDRRATDTRANLIKEVYGLPGQHHSHVYEYVHHLRTQSRALVPQASYEDLPSHLRREKDPARYKVEFKEMAWKPGDR